MNEEMNERYAALRRHCYIALEHLPEWARAIARVMDWRYDRYGSFTSVEVIVDLPLGEVMYIWRPEYIWRHDVGEYNATSFATGKAAKFATFDEAVQFAGGDHDAL